MVVASHGGALAFRAMGACRHSAIGSTRSAPIAHQPPTLGRRSAVRRLVPAALAATLAGCSVKLPAPPQVADQQCVLECQAQHIRCLHLLGTNRSSQKRCAGYLGECYEGSCKAPDRAGPHETGPNQPNPPEEQPAVDSPPTGG